MGSASDVPKAKVLIQVVKGITSCFSISIEVLKVKYLEQINSSKNSQNEVVKVM